MLPEERAAVFSLASIFSLRMFGLFMLLPVLAIYADQLVGVTPVLLGLALGIYGLTQAIFQIPFGVISDRINRKHVIAVGLIVFALGSIIAAQAETIFWLIVGRAVQGVGAVSAAILALNADLTREEQRTKAMAIVGMCIGFSFVMSLILAPVIQDIVGVDGMFWLIAGLALMAIAVLYWVVPNPQSPGNELDDPDSPHNSGRNGLIATLKNKQLLQLNFGIMVLHLILTALFLVLPKLLIEKSGFDLASHWKIYLPVLLVSVVGMVPFVIAGSKMKTSTISYRLAIVLLLVSVLFLVFVQSREYIWVFISLSLFFSAFNALESLLPSLVSRIASPQRKGAAMGIYNSFQFLGIFFGGLVGGWLYGNLGVSGVFQFCSAVVCIWLVYTCFSEGFSGSSSNS